MDKDLRMRLRTKGQSMDATVHVGKEGPSEGVEAELNAQLKRNHLVKVRIHRSAVAGRPGDKDAQGKELAERLGAEMVERRGHTVLLYRRKAPKKRRHIVQAPDKA